MKVRFLAAAEILGLVDLGLLDFGLEGLPAAEGRK